MEQAPFKSPSDPPPPLWPEVTTPAQLTPSSLERLPHPPSTVLSSLTGHKPTVCTVVRRSFLNSLIVFPLWLSHCPGGQSPVSQSLSRDPLCSLPSPHWAALAGRAPSTSGTCCCLTSRPLHLPGALPESPFPPCLFLTCQGPAELSPTKNACDPPPQALSILYCHPARSHSCSISGSHKWAGTPLVPDRGPQEFVEGKNK